MCASVEDLFSLSKWEGKGIVTRKRLVEKLLGIIFSVVFKIMFTKTNTQSKATYPLAILNMHNTLQNQIHFSFILVVFYASLVILQLFLKVFLMTIIYLL